MPLTPYQELAAESRGGGRLVSAAAGSGKTKVLVERLLRRVARGADIDDFLVVTYTRAAAGELRSRISRELGTLIAAHPEDRRLRRQTQLVCRADIGTIDSLCGRFLRENTHLAGIAPDFRVIEPDRADAIRAGVLERLMDSVYESIETDAGLRSLVDSFGAGRNDQKLTELLLRLHASLQSHPDPSAWLREQRAALTAAPGADAAASPWGAYLLERAAAQADYWERRLSELLTELLQPGNEKRCAAYGPTLDKTAEGLRAVARAAGQGWDAAREAALAVEFPKAGRFPAGDPLIEDVKAAREECKKLAGKKWAALFSQDSAALRAEMTAAAPAMEALLRLTEALDEAYAREKKRRGVVDFSDQEHMVLRLLEDPATGLARSLSDRYEEVLVDEYQDVNACQDRLFALLSDHGRRLFCVGDVKQSIYRFRLADPSLFLDKYGRWSDVYANMSPGEPGRILLRENFRSRPEILQGCNHVFRSIMSRSLGELDYDEAAALRPGRPFPGEGAAVELTVLSDPEHGEEDDERPDADEMEARYVAEKIRSLADSGVLVTEGDELRPARWGDFAILLRAKKAAPCYRAALAELGIPAAAQQGSGFFRSLEVTVLLSLLAVIDNPRQDVALIAALRSPLFGFTADDLSAIRARDRRVDFYTALRSAGKSDEKCAAFLRELEGLRALAPDLSVEELLERVCDRTELYALLAAMPDALARRENVQLLLDYARQFEQNGYRGLFSFLDWMRRLEQRGEEPRTGLVEQREAVQIISIHHAKGLEYPIVFLCGTGKQFNLTDTRYDVLFHPALGVGGRVTDTALGQSYPSLAWRAVSEKLREETLSEEMRVLYVAMTRACDRLYITGRTRDAAALKERLSRDIRSPLPPELLRGDPCPLHWLLRAALLPESPLLLRWESNAAGPPAAVGTEEAPEKAEPAPPEDLSPRLGWRYGAAWAAALPSKLTASALRGRALPDPEAVSLAPEDAPRKSVRRPDFTAAAAPLTGTEKGTAVHAVLQFMDFARGGSEEEIRGEIDRLLREGRLSPAQAAAAEPGWIAAFFRSDIGRRVLTADELWREQRFSLLCGAEDFFDVPPGEEILLQGMVDLCIREGDALTVVDYKTDIVTEESLGEKAAAYAPQIRAYAAALERMLGRPVKEGVLFFLRAGKAVTAPLE